MLVLASLWLAMGIGFTWPVLFLLLLAGLGIISFSVLVMLDNLTGGIRLASVTGDALFAYLLFFLAGPVSGDIGWIGLLPLITAAIYYQWVGAFILTILNMLVQAGLVYLQASLQDFFIFVGVLLPVYLLVGMAVAYFSQSLSRGKALLPRRPAARMAADRAARDRRRTMYDLIAALSASLNYERVLETALDLSTQTLNEMNAPAERMVSAVCLFGESGGQTELQVGTSRRMPVQDTRITLPGIAGLIGKTIDEGRSELSRNIKDDPELGRFFALRDCSSAYCLPLRSGLDAYGILLFAHPDIDFFTPERREVLDIVGNQAVIALQNARLYKDLEQEKERMMEFQEEARKKMARDLHDGPTQSIAAIAMRVNFARRLMERDPKSASEELFKIEELARRTTKEIRHMLFTLRPLVLESQGLVAALDSMAEKMKETYGQNVVIQADQRFVELLELGKQAVIFYIAEEAVNNARKHAQAESIWVRLKLLREDVGLLEIEDNGVGFNVSAVDTAYENRGSLGMVNMRERTELVNGVLRIDSVVGRGTRVQVVIPLTEEASDRIRRGI
jgi:signal transduction histidine kinase